MKIITIGLHHVPELQSAAVTQVYIAATVALYIYNIIHNKTCKSMRIILPVYVIMCISLIVGTRRRVHD